MVQIHQDPKPFLSPFLRFFAMRSFRKKVFVSYVLLIVLFLGLMIPAVTNSVQHIVLHSMNDCADELIKDLILAQTDEELVETLKNQKRHLFYRVGILDGERRLLYDSHTRRLLGTPFFPLQFVTHPEIEDALLYGSGHSEEFSYLFGQKLVYVAKRFDFHGKPYILRIAFPFQYIQDLRNGFTLGFLFFGTIVLILFSALAAMVINHFSSPIRTITAAIKNYKEGNLTSLPEIHLKASSRDEFSHLAHTINSLSLQVKREIESVTCERNEKEAILESLTEGVIALDSDLSISYANTKASYLIDLGYPLRGKTLSENYMKIVRQCFMQKKLCSDEIEIKKASEKLFIHVVATPRIGGGVLLVLHDKSVHYRLLEMRKAFIANASHELKTPITIIRGFAETLQDNIDLPGKTVAEITTKIVNNCSRMTTIIKNLLTLADIENLPSFRLSPIQLPQLVQECVSTIQPAYPLACIHIVNNTKHACPIQVDKSLIEIAVNNLLDNAAKYSKGNPEITVTIEESDSHAILHVLDNGIGIPESELPCIFQRFYRVNKANSIKLGGSGLGLSIVETIIHKHLGEIRATSNLGIGTTFTISIPKDLEQQLLLQEELKK